MKTRLLTNCVLIAVGAALSACGGADQQSEEVCQANFADWPLTVESGMLKCEGPDGVGRVTVEVDGKTCAVNGPAKGDESNADIARGERPGARSAQVSEATRSITGA